MVKLHALAGPADTLTESVGALDIVGVTADSREVKPGFLFAALPGVKADGARFIANAVAAGARAVLCGADVQVAEDVAVLRDRNPRLRLAKIAARFYGAQPDIVAASW